MNCQYKGHLSSALNESRKKTAVVSEIYMWYDHGNQPVKATNVCTQSKQIQFNTIVEKIYPEPWN